LGVMEKWLVKNQGESKLDPIIVLYTFRHFSM
jgi:hypothetical protein